MKANELRIGNHANILGVDVVLTMQDLYEFHNKKRIIKPIKLTEDWLLDHGFKYSTDLFYSIKTGISWVTLEVCLIHKRVILFDRKKAIFIDLKYTKYVHELQNLYFEITKKELIG